MGIVKITHTIDEINPLVKRAFGKRCKGNFLNAYSQCGLIETGHLEVMGDQGIPFFGNPFFGHVPFFPQKTIGRFDSKDGSVVRVMPKYAEEAKNYAQIYKERFGKEVRIIIDNQAGLLNYVDAWA